MAQADNQDTPLNVENISKAPQQTRNEKLKNSNEKNLDPTRYGDWEKGGRCIDF